MTKDVRNSNNPLVEIGVDIGDKDECVISWMPLPKDMERAVRNFVKNFSSVNMGELKVIDFECKGNVVRLYLGVGTDYWGDDWDDVPYEHNAGTVYDEYVRGYVDVAFPFNMLVREPSDDWTGNSRWSKDDMKKRKVPCIVVTDDNDSWDDKFSTAMADDSSRKIYFGDTVESLMSCGGAILEASIER